MYLTNKFSQLHSLTFKRFWWCLSLRIDFLLYFSRDLERRQICTVNLVTVYMGLLGLHWKTVLNCFLHVQRMGGGKHAVISYHLPPQSQSVGPKNSGHICWLTSAAAGAPGDSRQEPTWEGHIPPGLPGIPCHVPTCNPLCPLTLNSWQADLDWHFFFLKLLFQVIPSWILLLIFFKAGLRILWSQLQFHPSFCLIISGKICVQFIHVSVVWTNSLLW